MKTKLIALASLGLAVSVSAQPVRRHRVSPGDTLWDLAKKYYNDPFKWRLIADANPSPSVVDPDRIYPDQLLVIPADNEVAAKKDEALPVAPPIVPPSQPPSPPPVEPASRPPERPKDDGPGMVALMEGVSEEIPEGMVGQPPSMYHLKPLSTWKPDGAIVQHEGFESVAQSGDWVAARIDSDIPTGPGMRYIVFRKGGKTEEDNDPKGWYLTRVGTIEVRAVMGNRLYKALVIDSNDAVQEGDLISGKTGP